MHSERFAKGFFGGGVLRILGFFCFFLILGRVGSDMVFCSGGCVSFPSLHINSDFILHIQAQIRMGTVHSERFAMFFSFFLS